MELESNDFDNKTKKDEKPISTSIGGIKREHDSLDDFEHLDPEISPLKDLPSVQFPSKHVESESNLFSPLDSDVKDVDLDSFTKSIQPSGQNVSEPVNSKDLFSDLSTDYKQKDETSALGSVEFENTHKPLESNHKDPNIFEDFKADDFSVTSKHDIMKFLEAETSNNKTDTESDLKLTSDALDRRDIFPEKHNSLDSGEETAKPLVNLESNFDTSKEDNHGLLPSKFSPDHDSLEQVHPTTDSKSDFEGEEIGYKYEPASSVDDFEHIPQHKSKEDLHFDNITHSSDNVLEPVKTLIPVSEPKKSDEVKTTSELSKPAEIVKPTELDEFLDTEPVNEPEPKIEQTAEPKPVPVIVPVKSADKDVKPKEEKPPKIKTSSLDDIIGPEDVFKKIGLDAWFNPDRFHPKVEALIYWRDPKKSGVVFGGILAILLSLAYLSLISVVAYVSIFTLFGTIVFRVYKSVLQAVQKTSDGHPFKEFLELELQLPQDKVRELTDTAVTHINAAIVELRRLFLVEDLVDSLKFAVVLWCLTYIGALFNGLTLVILGFVALFTVPKVYENNKASIDSYLEIGRSKIAEITNNTIESCVMEEGPALTAECERVGQTSNQQIDAVNPQSVLEPGNDIATSSVSEQVSQTAAQVSKHFSPMKKKLKSCQKLFYDQSHLLKKRLDILQELIVQSTNVESSKEMHPIDQFFASLATMIKQLPPHLQIRVKSECSQSVFSAESLALINKQTNMPSTTSSKSTSYDK